MIDASTIPASHSAEVQIELVAGERHLAVAKTGPDYVVLNEAIDLDPCDAEVVVTIDGESHRWKVRLVQGAVPFDRKIATNAIE